MLTDPAGNVEWPPQYLGPHREYVDIIEVSFEYLASNDTIIVRLTVLNTAELSPRPPEDIASCSVEGVGARPDGRGGWERVGSFDIGWFWQNPDPGTEWANFRWTEGKGNSVGGTRSFTAQSDVTIGDSGSIRWWLPRNFLLDFMERATVLNADCRLTEARFQGYGFPANSHGYGNGTFDIPPNAGSEGGDGLNETSQPIESGNATRGGASQEVASPAPGSALAAFVVVAAVWVSRRSRAT